MKYLTSTVLAVGLVASSPANAQFSGLLGKVQKALEVGAGSAAGQGMATQAGPSDMANLSQSCGTRPTLRGVCSGTVSHDVLRRCTVNNVDRGGGGMSSAASMQAATTLPKVGEAYSYAIVDCQVAGKPTRLLVIPVSDTDWFAIQEVRMPITGCEPWAAISFLPGASLGGALASQFGPNQSSSGEGATAYRSNLLPGGITVRASGESEGCGGGKARAVAIMRDQGVSDAQAAWLARRTQAAQKAVKVDL